jgi:hypothetical protein
MSKSGFHHVREDRYFEDYVPGAVQELGSVVVDEEKFSTSANAMSRCLIRSTKKRPKKASMGA